MDGNQGIRAEKKKVGITISMCNVRVGGVGMGWAVQHREDKVQLYNILLL